MPDVIADEMSEDVTKDGRREDVLGLTSPM